MWQPYPRFTVRWMMVAVGVVGIGLAIGAKVKQGNEATLRYLVFNATWDAKRDLGDLSEFDLTYEWTGTRNCAQVDFRPKHEKRIREGRRYLVTSCCCGVDVTVKAMPLP